MSPVPPVRFNLSQIFTRVLPGIALIGTVIISDYIGKVIEMAPNDTSPEPIIIIGHLSSIEGVTVLLLIALILGEIVHLAVQNLSSPPRYFRRLLYNHSGYYGVLGILQRRNVRLNQASDQFKEDKSTNAVSKGQAIKFKIQTHISSLIIEARSTPILQNFVYFAENVSSVLIAIRDRIYSFIKPDWIEYDNKYERFTEDDLSKVFATVKSEADLPREFNDAKQLYMIFLHRVKDVESFKTKNLRTRYEAIRNIEYSLYFSIAVMFIHSIYMGAVNGHLMIGVAFSFIIALVGLIIITLLHQIKILSGIERQYIKSMILEYFLANEKVGDIKNGECDRKSRPS